MNIPTKILPTGFELPILGMGTWMMGGDTQRNPLNNDQADIDMLRYGLQQGITRIDTAERYANGHAEELVAQAIKGFDRSKLFISSKVWPEHLSYDGVLTAAKNSLKRLDTTYLDLYMIHFPNPKFSIAETMRAMQDLVKQGLIKNIGVSNFSVAKLQEAQQASDIPIVYNQLHYNLIQREIESKGVLDFCQGHDIIVDAYRPLQQGKLAKEGTALLNEMAAKYSKTPAQIALNWLISQQNVATICTMRTTDELESNLGAIGWQLEPTDIEGLRTEFPNQEMVSDSVALE
jgi:diketogulonate reductase-like aldo/keto reductase